MVVMFADSLGKSGNPISERNKFLAFAITSSVVLLAAFTFLLTSILGVYSGVIALRGASDAIFSLVCPSRLWEILPDFAVYRPRCLI